MSNLYYPYFEPNVQFEKPNLPSAKECFEYLRQFLANFDFITTNDVGNLYDYFEYFHYPKNEVILSKGEVCTDLYFIVKGSLIKYVEDELGKNIILFITETNFCAAVKSLHFQLPSNYYIASSENVYGLKLSYQNYFRLVADKPDFMNFFQLMIDETIDLLIDRIRVLLALDAKQRYEVFLKQYPDVYQRFNLQDISNFLGITPETLSRLRNTKKSAKS